MNFLMFNETITILIVTVIISFLISRKFEERISKNFFLQKKPVLSFVVGICVMSFYILAKEIFLN
ncbi:hypothetical protein AB834_05380 [PVC group bacterium (ex Bugula neritina AB1)]|nr:hypothetical protein AB834_05380 [PVC group bacterium (ex Bugula neritina AB1)]